MAVKIRLKRMGAKKRPFYRVVVADARSPRDGRFIESVGYYDPLKNPKVFQVDDERIRHWMATGARPSDAVRELLERQGTLPATAHPVRTKTGPKRAPKPSRGPAATAPPVAPVADPEVAGEAEETPAATEPAAEVAADAPVATQGGEEATEVEPAEVSEEASRAAEEAAPEEAAPEKAPAAAAADDESAAVDEAPSEG
ncbi:MAG TPA: 30S ribosomal protein S16 [Candidatus Acidoferrales bacterium]|nr:30S ribosomal protein S16 [Candidatus Acidoferrales bacterium]